MASILPQLSEKGTSRHQIELEMINFIQDFLYEAEGIVFNVLQIKY